MKKGYIVITEEYRKEGKRWVAYCHELGTSTFGRSIPEAQRKMKEAILLQLNTLEQVGERERFFKENNIHFYATRPKKDVSVRVRANDEAFVRPRVQAIGEAIAA